MYTQTNDKSAGGVYLLQENIRNSQTAIDSIILSIDNLFKTLNEIEASYDKNLTLSGLIESFSFYKNKIKESGQLKQLDEYILRNQLKNKEIINIKQLNEENLREDTNKLLNFELQANTIKNKILEKEFLTLLDKTFGKSGYMFVLNLMFKEYYNFNTQIVIQYKKIKSVLMRSNFSEQICTAYITLMLRKIYDDFLISEEIFKEEQENKEKQEDEIKLFLKNFIENFQRLNNLFISNENVFNDQKNTINKILYTLAVRFIVRYAMLFQGNYDNSKLIEVIKKNIFLMFKNCIGLNTKISNYRFFEEIEKVDQSNYYKYINKYDKKVLNKEFTILNKYCIKKEFTGKITIKALIKLQNELSKIKKLTGKIKLNLDILHKNSLKSLRFLIIEKLEKCKKYKFTGTNQHLIKLINDLKEQLKCRGRYIVKLLPST
jgi:hypothetical protein